MARVTLKNALVRVARVWQEQAAAGELSLETVALYIQIAERLLRFAAAHGVTRLDDITGTLAQDFITAPGHDRYRGVILTPAGGTRRQRRSALESLFFEARVLGLTRAAPLLDLPPIPRSPRTWQRRTPAVLPVLHLRDLPVRYLRLRVGPQHRTPPATPAVVGRRT